MREVQRPVYATRPAGSVCAKLRSLVDDVITAYLDMLVFQTAMVMIYNISQLTKVIQNAQQKMPQRSK